MSHIPSYGKIFALGHRDIATIFDGPVVVEEKIDGSFPEFYKTEIAKLLFENVESR